MAKLSVWLHTGMTIPSTGMQTNTADGTDALVYYDGTRGTGGWGAGSVIGDGYAELSGSEAAIKNDYKLLTGYTLDSNGEIEQFPIKTTSGILNAESPANIVDVTGITYSNAN